MLRNARRKGNVLPEKVTWMNIASILRPFSEGFLQVELWLRWGLGGDELFFDEFVYLWSVEVYICTDVRNSSYLQKCASFTLVPYYSLHNHCRVLHVRTFAPDFDRSIFFLAEYWMLFSAVHSHTKVTLDDYLFETDDKIQCYLQVKVFIYFYTCIVLFIIAS